MLTSIFCLLSFLGSLQLINQEFLQHCHGLWDRSWHLFDAGFDLSDYALSPVQGQLIHEVGRSFARIRGLFSLWTLLSLLILLPWYIALHSRFGMSTPYMYRRIVSTAYLYDDVLVYLLLALWIS